MSIKHFRLCNTNGKQVATALDFGITYKDDTLMCLWLSLCGPLCDLRNDVTPAYLKQIGTTQAPDLSKRGVPADHRAIDAIAEIFDIKITVRFIRFAPEYYDTNDLGRTVKSGYQITDIYQEHGTGLNRIELGWDGGHFILIVRADNDLIDDIKLRYQKMMEHELSQFHNGYPKSTQLKVSEVYTAPRKTDLIEQFKRAQTRVNELAEMHQQAKDEVLRIYGLLENIGQ